MAAVHVREWEDWPDFLSLPENCVVSSLQHRESSHSSDTNGDFCGIIEGVGLHLRKRRHETQWGLGILKGLPWEGKVRLGPRVRGRMHRSKPGWVGGGFGACVEELPLGEVGLSRCRMALCLVQWVLGTVKDLKFLPYLQAYSLLDAAGDIRLLVQRQRDSGHKSSVNNSTCSWLPWAHRSHRGDEDGPGGFRHV